MKQVPSGPQPLQIRAMQAHELARHIDWAAQEGWNPGLHDAQAFHGADPQGFLLAELAGEPVGMVSAVRYGAHYGFIGFYIVRPDFRGRGHGMALWQAGMARLSGRLVGLDGVVAQQANYRKSGFVLAHNNVRMQGAAHGHGPLHSGIVPLAGLNRAALLQYDSAVFPAERRAFLQAWISQPGTVALGLLQQGRLCGYGVVRPCRSGYKVGPLMADDDAAARHLFNALVQQVPEGAPVALDIAVGHDAAQALARDWALQPVFETARMYTGAAPALALHRQFGITSFELG